MLALLKYSGTQEIIQSVRTQLTVLGLGTWAPHALVYRNSYYESTCVKTKKVATEVQGTVCPPNVKWDPAALVQVRGWCGGSEIAECDEAMACMQLHRRRPEGGGGGSLRDRSLPPGQNRATQRGATSLLQPALMS